MLNCFCAPKPSSPPPSSPPPPTITTTTSTPPPPPPTPKGFLCPISRSLMADPVYLSTGETFDQAYIEACKELNYIPPCISWSYDSANFLASPLIPNPILKSLITSWCDSFGCPHPVSTSQEAARAYVERLKAEAGGRGHQEPSSSGHQEIDISSKKAMLHDLVQKVMMFPDMVTALIHESVVDEVIQMIRSSDEEIQVNATYLIYNYTLKSTNNIKIAKSEAVPNLVHVLNKGVSKARSYAAGVFYNFFLQGQEISEAKCSSEAIEALLRNFSDPKVEHAWRIYAGHAAIYLLGWPENYGILTNIGTALLQRQVAAKELRDDEIDLREDATDVMCNSAESSDGRRKLYQAGFVEVMLRMMRKGEGLLDKFVLCSLHKFSTVNSDWFTEIAMAAGVEDLLAMEKEEWGEEGRKMAREILGIIHQREAEHEETTADEFSRLEISDNVDGQSSQ